MQIIIQHTNFKSSKALDKFIHEKAESLLVIRPKILNIEFHLSCDKIGHESKLIIHIRGKIINAKRTTDDMHYSILKCIDAAKKSLRKEKTQQQNRKKNSP